MFGCVSVRCSVRFSAVVWWPSSWGSWRHLLYTTRAVTCVYLRVCSQAVDLIATVIHLSRPCALLFLRDSGVACVSQLLRVCPSSHLTADLFHAVVRLVCALTGAHDPNGSSPHDVSRAVRCVACVCVCVAVFVFVRVFVCVCVLAPRFLVCDPVWCN